MGVGKRRKEGGGDYDPRRINKIARTLYEYVFFFPDKRQLLNIL